MSGAAAEGAAQIAAAAVAGVGEETDPAIAAAREAGPRAGFSVQNKAPRRPEGRVVLADQGARGADAVPLGTEMEVRLQGYRKKPRRSLKRLMECGMVA